MAYFAVPGREYWAMVCEPESRFPIVPGSHWGVRVDLECPPDRRTWFGAAVFTTNAKAQAYQRALPVGTVGKPLPIMRLRYLGGRDWQHCTADVGVES